MGRYTPKISVEGSAAFSDELSSSNLRAQDRYQKGYSGDDPIKIEQSKLDDQADVDVAADIQELTDLTDGGDTSFSIENPEMTTAEDENLFDPHPIPSIIESGDPESQPTTVDSLERLMTTLEESDTFVISPSRSTRPAVDIYLDDDQKTAMDEEVQSLVERDPETCASLESIVLCDERNVTTLKQIISHTLERLKHT